MKYIQKHKTLNKKIWIDSEYLNLHISDLLMKFLWQFLQDIKNKYNINVSDLDINDIILYGFTADYFYHKKSDINILVVLNTKKLEKQFPNTDIAEMLKRYYYNWNLEHHAKIYSHKIIIDFTSYDIKLFNPRHRPGPQYSILSEQWLFKPIPVSQKDLYQMMNDAKKTYDEIMHDYKDIKKNGFIFNQVKNLYSNIASSLNIAYHDNPTQNINSMHIAFYKLTRKGIIKKLYTLIKLHAK